MRDLSTLLPCCLLVVTYCEIVAVFTSSTASAYLLPPVQRHSAAHARCCRDVSSSAIISNNGISSTAHDNDEPMESLFSIEQVSSRDRVVDVYVFRNWWRTVPEECQEKSGKADVVTTIITPQEVLRRMTINYNDIGQFTSMLNGGGPLVHFAAVCSSPELPPLCVRANGVVASVDAQVLMMQSDDDSSSNSDDGGAGGADNNAVYLKNLHVQADFRRRGLAGMLVQAVKDFAAKEGVSRTFLHVDADNFNAVRLYQGVGFVLEEEYEGDGRMIYQE